jgi:hypothetical protein
MYSYFPEDTTYEVLVREMVYINYLNLIKTVRTVFNNITILGLGGPCEGYPFLELEYLQLPGSDLRQIPNTKHK